MKNKEGLSITFSVVMKNKEGLSITFSVVYGEKKASDRENLWAKLHQIHSKFNNMDYYGRLQCV